MAAPGCLYYSLVQEDRNDLKTELLITREAQLQDFKNSQDTNIGKNKKDYLRENTKGIAI